MSDQTRHPTEAEATPPDATSYHHTDKPPAHIVGVVQQQISSPLPPPDMLQAYEQIKPGLMDDVIEMVKKEQSHRHQCIETSLNQITRGQWMGFFIALVALMLTAWLIYIGKDAQALVFGLGTLAALIGAFTLSRREQEADKH